MTRFALPTAIVSAFVVGGFVAVFFVFLNHNRNSAPCTGCQLPLPVLVAKVSIPKGTSGRAIGTKGLYSTKYVQWSQMVKGAVIDPSKVRGEVTTRTIPVDWQPRGRFETRVSLWPKGAGPPHPSVASAVAAIAIKP